MAPATFTFILSYLISINQSQRAIVVCPVGRQIVIYVHQSTTHSLGPSNNQATTCYYTTNYRDKWTSV